LTICERIKPNIRKTPRTKDIRAIWVYVIPATLCNQWATIATAAAASNASDYRSNVSYYASGVLDFFKRGLLLSGTGLLISKIFLELR
jgi:hypothetical protein